MNSPVYSWYLLVSCARICLIFDDVKKQINLICLWLTFTEQENG